MQHYLIKDQIGSSTDKGNMGLAAKEAKRRLHASASNITVIFSETNLLTSYWMLTADAQYFGGILEGEGIELGEIFTARHILDVNKKAKKAKVPVAVPETSRVVHSKFGAGNVIETNGGIVTVDFEDGEIRKIKALFLKDE